MNRPRVPAAVAERLTEQHVGGEAQALEQEAADRAAAETPRTLVAPIAGEGPHPGVENDHPAHALRMVERIRETDRASEVVHDEREVLQPERVHEASEPAGLILRSIGDSRRLLGQ